MTRQAIAVWENKFAEKCQNHNSANFSDFEVPLYNVWKQQTKTAGVNHFGNSEVRWLENLLYLYWRCRTLKEEKERKKEKAFKLWLACHTQEEIAEATDVPRKTIDDWTGDFGEKLAADNSPFPADFEVPLYNVWKQQTKTAGVNHFGNSEVRWLENLLYLYTNPADIVVDPFAGSGSTIDLCKKRKRRYPYANVFPLLAADELATLAADIRSQGLQQPIVLLNGQILDGRNRYLACEQAGVAPRFTDYTGDDPVGFVVSANLKRRHLNESQRAMVGATIKPLFEEQAKQRQYRYSRFSNQRTSLFPK